MAWITEMVVQCFHMTSITLVKDFFFDFETVCGRWSKSQKWKYLKVHLSSKIPSLNHDEMN